MKKSLLLMSILFSFPFFSIAQDNMKGPTGGPKSKQQIEAEKKQKKAKEAGYKLVEKAEKEHMKHQTKEGRKRMKETKKKSEKTQRTKRRTSLDVKPNELFEFACLSTANNHMKKHIILISV